MSRNSRRSRRKWRDADDAPAITQEWVDSANLYHGDKLVRKRSRILREVHESAAAMHRTGAIDEQTMREFKAMACPQTIAEIRELLARRSSDTPRTSAAQARRRERKKQ